MRDHESAAVLRIGLGGFLVHFADAGKARTFFQNATETSQLLRCAGSQHFDAAIETVAHVAGDAQLLAGVQSEETEANALDNAGYEIAFGLPGLRHDSVQPLARGDFEVTDLKIRHYDGLRAGKL